VPKDILELYIGQGETLEKRNTRLPEYETITGEEKAENYIAPNGLRHAVNVALALGQPLLITGEPGTGKTRLANSIAYELGVPLLEFYTKTNSTATDLFYQYDALQRFQDIHLEVQKPMEAYIKFHALGEAILLANPTEHASSLLRQELKAKGPTRSVVLIDEIDKAPRDLPNDILNEIERMSFKVKEAEWSFEAAKRYRPIIVMTSNTEKDLPDAFLRRCVYYHIPFPDSDMLKGIVKRRFAKDHQFSSDFESKNLEKALKLFKAIRGLDLRKKPATAEFLAWLSILMTLGVDLSRPFDEKQKEQLRMSYSVLAKNNHDLERMRNYLPVIE